MLDPRAQRLWCSIRSRVPVAASLSAPDMKSRGPRCTGIVQERAHFLAACRSVLTNAAPKRRFLGAVGGLSIVTIKAAPAGERLAGLSIYTTMSVNTAPSSNRQSINKVIRVS